MNKNTATTGTAGPSAPAAATESSTAIKPTDILQYNLTQEVLAVMLRLCREPRHARNFRYEVRNITERWLMAMANLPKVHPEDLEIYKRLDARSAVHLKAASEIWEKRYASALAEAEDAFERVVALVNKRLAEAAQLPPAPVPSLQAGILTVGPLKYTVTARFKRVLAAAGYVAENGPANAAALNIAAAIVLRYEAALAGSQHWGVPQAHANILYDTFGVSGEGFASPLNSRFIGKPGAVFCSAFPDTDGPVGSVGSFFEQDLAGRDWLINPPYIESLMLAAAWHVIGCMERVLAASGHGPSNKRSGGAADGGFTVYFIVPSWKDSEAFKLLTDTRFLSASLTLEPRTYKYEAPDDQDVLAVFGSTYFALSTHPDTRHAAALRSIRAANTSTKK